MSGKCDWLSEFSIIKWHFLWLTEWLWCKKWLLHDILSDSFFGCSLVANRLVSDNKQNDDFVPNKRSSDWLIICKMINELNYLFWRINENLNKISVRLLSFRPYNFLFDVLETKLFESLSVMLCASVNFYLRYWRRNRSKDLLLIITTINCQLSSHLKLERQLLTPHQILQAQAENLGLKPLLAME